MIAGYVQMTEKRCATRNGYVLNPNPRVQEWIDLMKDIFAQIYVKANGLISKLSPIAQRQPSLKQGETERILDIFEQLVVTQELDWSVWKQRIV